MLTSDAGIAQLVEHNLAMVRVASSNLVSRSKVWRVSKAVIQRIANSYSSVRLWNAPPTKVCPGGEIGRHKGLKIPRNLYFRVGSTPTPGTTYLAVYDCIFYTIIIIFSLFFKYLFFYFLIFYTYTTQKFLA